MECKFCGRELEDDAVYCLYCGKRLDGKKPCPSCNALLPEEATFCGKCGTRIAPGVLEEEPAAVETPEEEAPEKQAPGEGTPEETAEAADGTETVTAPVEEDAEEVTEPDGESGQPDVTEEGEEDGKAEEGDHTKEAGKAENKPECEVKEPEKKEVRKHSAIWKKAIEITQLCLVGLAAIVGFIFTFCIGVSVKADGVVNVSLFDYFGKVYNDLDIISNQVGNTQSFALYLPYIFGTLIAIAALVCNFVFTAITVIAIVRQYSFQNKKVNFIKPAMRTFISYAIFAAVFFALNATPLPAIGDLDMGEYLKEVIGYFSHTRVYFNKVTLVALIIGGVAFGGYFACNAVLRLHDFTDKKEIIKSSVALGTGVFGIVIATLLTFSVCRFSTATHSYSLGLMPMILQSAFELTDGTNCGGVMCFGIIGYAVQVTLLILTIIVIIAIARRIGSGSGKMPLAVAISAAALSVVFFFGVFAAANMLNAEAVPDSISRSYGVPITVIVFSFIMLGGLIATIVLDNIYKRTDN